MNFYFIYYMVGGGIYGKMSSYCLSAPKNPKKAKLRAPLLLLLQVASSYVKQCCSPHLSFYYYD